MRDEMTPLDELEMRDLWNDVISRIPDPPEDMPERRAGSRLAAAAVAITVFVAAGTLVFQAFDGDPKGSVADPPDRSATSQANGTIVGVCSRPTNLQEGGGASLCSVAPGSDDPVWLTPAGEIDTQPEWSPDGTRIVFVRGAPNYERYEDGTEIVIIDAAGREIPFQLGRADLYSPTWAPDGNAIAYEKQGQIFMTPVDEPAPVPLTPRLSDRLSAYTPAWSPDGSSIAFTGYTYDASSKTESQSLYLMNPDGSGMHPITDPALDASDPSWSPDGERIAFTSELWDAIYVVNRDGTGTTRLTENLRASAPEWSPDGRSILFSAARGTYVIDLESGATSLLLDDLYVATWQAVPGGDDAAISPTPPSGDAVAPPSPEDASYSLWLSAGTVPPGPVELVAMLVNHDGTEAVFGAHATVDRWDGNEWIPYGDLVMCMDHWHCTGRVTPAGGSGAVPSIGLGAGLGRPGPVERFTTDGLEPGWYRISQEANEGITATGIVQVIEGAPEPPSLVPVDDPAISISPALLPTSGGEVTLYPLIPAPSGSQSREDIERAVRGLSDIATIERWTGSGWDAFDKLDVRLGVQGGGDDLARFTHVPPASEGAYRIVRDGPDGAHVGQFWVSDEARSHGPG